MKLKNKMKDVRQLRVSGQVVMVNPGATVEVESANYDKNVFEMVDIKNRNEKIEKLTKKEEVK
jgi:predicted phosphodiesterase